MAIHVKCQCSYEVNLSEDLAGSVQKCPMCGRNIPVPAAGQTEKPVSCENCRHVERRFKWQPGATCPKCGSEKFLPLVVREGAYDYALADRSKGPANEDRRLGQLARWAGLININQLNEALKKVRSCAASDGKGKPVGDVLVEEGLLSQHQLSELLSVIASPRVEEEEKKFCEVAKSNKFITADRADECLKQQSDLAAKGYQQPFVGFLLMEKKYMPDHQVMAILKAQQRHGKGMLAQLQELLEEKPAQAEETAAVVAAAPGVRPSWWKRSPVVAAAAVVIILVSSVRLAREFKPVTVPRPPVDLMCDSCGALSRGVIEQPPPYKCRKCGKQTVHRALKCMDCGHTFAFKTPPLPELYPPPGGVQQDHPGQPPAMPPPEYFEPPKCPKCKSYNLGPVTPPQPQPAPAGS